LHIVKVIAGNHFSDRLYEKEVEVGERVNQDVRNLKEKGASAG
jgi:hypothetical protein